LNLISLIKTGYYNRALDIFKAQLGENHVDVAVTLNDFAILQYQKGNYVEAESLYLKSIEIYTSIFGNAHPEVGSPFFNK
jgi:tetratricopeptide (TPR) repeat protein